MSAVQTGSTLSPKSKVFTGLEQGYCIITPMLFKICLNEALEQWKIKCSIMEIHTDGSMLFTLNSGDDLWHTNVTSYMVKKLMCSGGFK